MKLLAMVQALLSAFLLMGEAGGASGDLSGLHFKGVPASRVTLPPSVDPQPLQLRTFTLECWFRPQGEGESFVTGRGGVRVIPLVARGGSDGEARDADLNYVFGVRPDFCTLAADFEETDSGRNCRLYGEKKVEWGVWHHAAYTFDGATARLYLNGVLDVERELGPTVPAYDSKAPLCIGAALDTQGRPHGGFDGLIDEVRIWNRALAPQEIRDQINLAISSADGLVARWGMGRTSDGRLSDSGPFGLHGMLHDVGEGPQAPFDANDAPAPPQPLEPGDGRKLAVGDVMLQVATSDFEDDPLDVTFYKRRYDATVRQSFTIAVIPDSQYYVCLCKPGSMPRMFLSQTQWIRENALEHGIAFVCHVGDIVEHGDNPRTAFYEWRLADAAMSFLEQPIEPGYPEGIPYILAVGNHDQTPARRAVPDTTKYYNRYFGVERFANRSYYGGHYGDNNDNYYCFFEAMGMKFIVLSIEFNASLEDPSVLDWADRVLEQHRDHRAILVSHNLIGDLQLWSKNAVPIYESLKDNPNLFLMLCGHISAEARRCDTFEGNEIHTLLSDYQSRTNHGNGWMRLMEFRPGYNEISVKTYSPWLDEYETDGDSHFRLQYDMNHGGRPFQKVGTVAGVQSGNPARLKIPERLLSPGATYEWYAVSSDGRSEAVGGYARFSCTEQAEP